MGKPHTSKNKQKFASEEDKEKFSNLLSNMEQYGLDLDVFYIDLSEKKQKVRFFAILILIRSIERKDIKNKETREKFEMLKAKLILVPANDEDRSVIGYLTDDYCYFEVPDEFDKFFNSFTPSYSWRSDSNKFNAFVDQFFPQIPDKLNFSRISRDERKSVNKYFPKLINNYQYCYGLRRLGKRDGVQFHRTRENTNKAKHVCANLYKKIEKSTNVSFCFSNDPQKERSECEILKQYEACGHRGNII